MSSKATPTTSVSISSSSSIGSPAASSHALKNHALIAVCSLNQWAMDFEGNFERIRRSIVEAKRIGARYRVGPELEVCGYSCDDHYLELDTERHCWQVLARLMCASECRGIVCDVGMPVWHPELGALFNCRVLFLDGRILYISPKQHLAVDGAYRESRWFTEWHGNTASASGGGGCRRDSDGVPILPSHAAFSALSLSAASSSGGGVSHSSAAISMMRLPHCYIEVMMMLQQQEQDKPPQMSAPFGEALLEFDTVGGGGGGLLVGIEICESMWVSPAPHSRYFQSGAHLVLNSSASYHELDKLERRIRIVESASQLQGGAFIYCNAIGCDGGGRVCFDGANMAALNGRVTHRRPQFVLWTGRAGDSAEVQIMPVAVDLTAIAKFRRLRVSQQRVCAYSPSGGVVGERIRVRFDLCGAGGAEAVSGGTLGIWTEQSSGHMALPPMFSVAQEIEMGPSFWLWDHLRRNHARGFLLPLSGGVDSAAVASLVFCMCCHLVDAVAAFRKHQQQQKQQREGEGEFDLLTDIRRVVSDEQYVPVCAKELCGRLLFTVYMGCAKNSSAHTRQLAAQLAQQIGATHRELDIESSIQPLIATAQSTLEISQPICFRSQGGTHAHNLALQNVQARTRMVLAYLLAQLCASSPIGGLTGNKAGGGFRFVLGTSNLDEGLRGYYTKYDCSSADLNPIGSISKVHLWRFLQYLADSPRHQLTSLRGILNQPSTAELEPLAQDGSVAQTDEQDMGLSYRELSWFGWLRKVAACGPLSMLERVLGDRQLRKEREAQQHESQQSDDENSQEAEKTYFATLSPFAIADKIKHFFRCYAKNRHKMTTLTPSYHAESFDADDNRFDQRQFLYNSNWTWQFRCMDELLERCDHSSEN